MKKNFLIALSVFVILAGTAFGSYYFIESKIDHFLKSEIRKKLGDEYTFDYQATEWSVFESSVAVKELLLEKKSSVASNWKVEVDLAEMFGFKPLVFLKENAFRVDSVLIGSPEIKITNFNNGGRNKESKVADGEPSAEISFGKISLTEGRLTYNPEGPENLQTGFEFETTDLTIDQDQIGNILTWKDARVSLNDIRYHFSDSIYHAEVDRITYSSQNEEFSVLNTKLKSNLDIAEYSRQFGWRKSMFTAEIPEITIEKPINFGDSLGFIPKIHIHKPSVSLKKDLRFPLPDRITDLPQKLISNLSPCFQVDSVEVTDGEFAVGLKHDNGNETELSFSDVYANLTKIQNIKPALPAFVFNAHAIFMDEAELTLTTSYDYGDLEPFTISGKLDAVSLTFLDEFLNSSAGIELKEGALHELEFEMNGNTYGVSGTVDMEYSNLSLNLVDKETHEKRKFLSKVADLLGGLIFWKENPDNNEFRTGVIEMERDARKGFVAQWVDGLLDGMINSILRIDREKIEKAQEKRKERRENRGN
ncbi:MAG: hypothetical protein ABR574_06550 [Cryomorphaceae bacterium]|nr:hypothetical protein [Flavobacteriales bacterium]